MGMQFIKHHWTLQDKPARLLRHTDSDIKVQWEHSSDLSRHLGKTFRQ